MSAFLFFKSHLQYEEGKPWYRVMTDKFYMKISLILKVDLFRVQTLLVASQSKNGVHKLTSHSKYLIILQSDQSLSQQTQQCFFLEDSSASMNICIKES